MNEGTEAPKSRSLPTPQGEALLLLAAFTRMSEERFGKLFDLMSPAGQMLFLETAEEWWGEEEDGEERMFEVKPWCSVCGEVVCVCDKSKTYVCLHNLAYPALILTDDTAGTVYYNQVGCVCCLHYQAEGHYLPLMHVPLKYFGCETDEQSRAEMGSALMSTGMFAYIDVGEGVEAWLPIAFMFRNGERREGILTYPNCD